MIVYEIGIPYFDPLGLGSTIFGIRLFAHLMFAAVSTVPSRIAAGKPTPMGPVHSKCFASSATVPHTPSGVAPFGVGMRWRSVTSSLNKAPQNMMKSFPQVGTMVVQ